MPWLTRTWRWTSERVPRHWVYIVGLFLGTKAVLTLIGLVTLHAYEPFLAGLPGSEERAATDATQSALGGGHRWLAMWFIWDSFIYYDLARTPLDERFLQFAFPVLYPFLARPVAVLLGGDLALALLVINNCALLGLLYYAYRLGEHLLGDDAGARRFTRYLVLMPAAFVFHAALTESLFLCLVLAAFYHAERGHWIRVGVFGYFLSAGRSVGLLVAIPMALILLRQGGHRLDRKTLPGYLKNGWPLLLFPAGWLTFMAFCKWLSGDWFAYNKAQEQGWHITWQSPLQTIRNALAVPGRPSLFPGTPDADRAWFAIVALAVLLIAVALRQLGPAYAVYALLMILVPLSIGEPVFKSLLRYLVVVFPLALVFARWAKRPSVDPLLTAALAVLQGALFVLWLNYWIHYII